MLKEQLLTRREFLIDLGAFFGWTATTGLASILISQTREGTLPPENEVPRAISGVWINSPFLWRRESNYIYDVLTITRLLNASTLRVFAPALYVIQSGNSFVENTIQVHSFLMQVEEFCKQWNYPLGICLSLYDGYNLLHSNKSNFIYGSKPLSSPFLDPEIPVEKSQLDFFTDGNKRSVFIDLITRTVLEYSKYKCVTAFEIANEMEIPGEKNAIEKQELLTDWYHDVLSETAQVRRGFPTFTGLAYPWYVNEKKLKQFDGLINTAHVYIGQSLSNLKKHCETRSLPLGVTEIGVSERFPLTDQALALHIKAIENKLNHTVVNTPILGLWKIDDYNDTYNINLADYPQSRIALEEFRKNLGL